MSPKSLLTAIISFISLASMACRPVLSQPPAPELNGHLETNSASGKANSNSEPKAKTGTKVGTPDKVLNGKSEKGSSDNATSQAPPANGKELYLNIQEGTICQNGGAPKDLQIGDNRLKILGKARFNILGPGEVRIKGRGSLSVTGKGIIEIDQTPTIRASNFDGVSTIDKIDLAVQDCNNVVISNAANVKADHCNMVCSTGEAFIDAEHCKAVNITYGNNTPAVKDGIVKATECKEVDLSGGEISEGIWQNTSPRVIATDCETVRIYNASARAIDCDSVQIFGGKLEVKNCRSVKNLKPDSNPITNID